MRWRHAAIAGAVLLTTAMTLSACWAGTTHSRRAARSGPARAGALPLPDRTVRNLPDGVFYLMAGPNPFRYTVWEVTNAGNERRIGPEARQASGIRSIGSSLAGIVVSAADVGIDYIARLKNRAIFWLPGGRAASVHGFSPQITNSGLITYETPPGQDLNKWAIRIQRSFSAPPRIVYKQSRPLGSPVFGPAGLVATFTAPYSPKPGKIQNVVLITRLGKISRLSTGYSEIGELLWQPNAADLIVVAPGCRSELLAVPTGKTQQLPEGWCPYSWSPDGRGLLMLAHDGSSLGMWTPQRPSSVSVIGPLKHNIQIGQINWLAAKANV